MIRARVCSEKIFRGCPVVRVSAVFVPNVHIEFIFFVEIAVILNKPYTCLDVTLEKIPIFV
jgi:hypothetical protein